MAKPYKEGRGWAIRSRYKGEDIYLCGYSTAAAATKAAEAEKQAIDKFGKATRLGPHRTCLAVAFMDYARERLPFLKGARQDAQRINNYLRACDLPVIHLEEATTEPDSNSVRYFDVSFVEEGDRNIPGSLQAHRAAQVEKGEASTKQRKRIARLMVADVTRHHLQTFINAMKADGFAPASIGLERAELRRLFNYAKNSWSWSEPATNPATKLDMPKIDNARDRVLTNKEWKLITSALDGYGNPYVIPAIALLLQTAMRSSEPLIRATWANVDWERCILHLSTAKGGKRDVPLNPEAIESLRLLREKAEIDGCAGLASRILPTTYEALKKAWSTACKAAGVEGVKIHDLRHTAATRYALEYNGNIPVLKVITGHKTDSMLMRYIHIKASDVVGMMHGRPMTHDNAPAGYVVKAEELELPPAPPQRLENKTSNVIVVRAIA